MSKNSDKETESMLDSPVYTCILTILILIIVTSIMVFLGNIKSLHSKNGNKAETSINRQSDY